MGKIENMVVFLAKDAVSKLLSDVPLVNYTAFDLNSLQELQDIIGDMPMVLDDDYIDINPLWKKGRKLLLIEIMLKNLYVHAILQKIILIKQECKDKNYIFKLILINWKHNLQMIIQQHFKKCIIFIVN